VKPLEQVVAEDQTSLAMENDLLRYEIRHLRGRLEAQGKEITSLQSGAPPASDRTNARDAPGVVTERERRTRNDLVWLLRRLDRSPLRWLYSRRKGFVALRERYLDVS
jgi:hypothetical protein